LHNRDWMQQFINAYGVQLAPHGKTTMSPKLFEMQLQGGAWGITLATAHQTLVAYQHGVSRILMANQLIGKENMAVIARLLQDPDFTFYCLVDSADQINQLGAFYAKQGQRLQVLLELGVMGGRSGIRNDEQLQSCVDALSRWNNTLVLCGIEIYEGVLEEESSIRTFLQRAVDITRTLAQEARFHAKPILLSGAGSAWYDVVAEVFSAAGFGETVQIILRPGCYLTHDIGVYRKAQAEIQRRNPIAHKMSSSLLPALQVWAYVQSIPEIDKAIIAMGKRDVAFDAGLPTPAQHFRPVDASPKAAPAHWVLTKMMDQHAYLQISEQDDLRVGDMIGFDISHPCLTFDKWRSLPVLDAQYEVVDIVQTFF
jgi:D-serine dehydratase